MRKLLEIQRGDWAALVKYVREDTRLKTGPLAERVGVSPETWWRWERKGQNPRYAEVVERFAKAFGLELDDAMWAAGLLFPDQTEEQQPPDPRLKGLDPNDRVVIKIMSLDIDEEMRGWMLDRRRKILADRQRADLEEVEFLADRDRGAA